MTGKLIGFVSLLISAGLVVGAPSPSAAASGTSVEVKFNFGHKVDEPAKPLPVPHEGFKFPHFHAYNRKLEYQHESTHFAVPKHEGGVVPHIVREDHTKPFDLEKFEGACVASLDVSGKESGKEQGNEFHDCVLVLVLHIGGKQITEEFKYVAPSKKDLRDNVSPFKQLLHKRFDGVTKVDVKEVYAVKNDKRVDKKVFLVVVKVVVVIVVR